MSVEKSEFKILLLQNTGRALEARRDALEAQSVASAGAAAALKGASANIQKLTEQVDIDLDEQVIQKLEGPLQVAKYVKRYISRAAGVAESLEKASAQQSLRVEAVSQGVTEAAKILARQIDDERKSIAAVRAAEAKIAAGEDLKVRPPGVAPQKSIARRGKEALAKKRAAAKGKAARKCSYCKEPGHTIRNCKKKKK